MKRYLLIVLLAGSIIGPIIPLAAQVTITSSSTPQYSVTVAVAPVNLVNTNCATGSFSYQPQIYYRISYSSATAPVLTYLNGALYCNGDNSAFTLPTSSGTSTVLGASASYTGAVACSTATPSAIGCTYYRLNMAGTGISTRVIYTGIAAVPLPIDIIRFDARKEGSQVYLVWEAASTAKAAGIRLESSADGAAWTQSALQVEHHDGAKAQIFEAREALPRSGYRYYRLRQDEPDGTSSYSQTLAVRAESDLSSVAVVPNPVLDGHFRIEGLEDPGAWEVAVYNMASQRIHHQIGAEALISLQGIAPGLYMLQLTNRETGAGKALRFRKD